MPTLRELPKLTQLTLTSAVGGGGGTSGGGSTVFGILLALFALAGCVADPTLAPSGETHPLPQTISCRATVATGAIECGGPRLDAPAPEILGGQGAVVALRSSNVHYDNVSIFQADVNVQNLTAQTIGTGPAFTIDGIDVFFVSGPTVTGGTGSVTLNNATGTGTFTAAGQGYFHYNDSIPSLGRSSTLTWKWNVDPTVSTFAFTVAVSATVPDPLGVLRWSVFPEFASDSFIDLAVNSSTDAMAVGLHGQAYHKIGSSWVPLADQVGEDWVAVEAIGGGEYLGATMDTVYLFQGRVWKPVYAPGFQILSLGGRAADRIIVGGFEQLRWLGSSGWKSATVTGRTYKWVGAVGGEQAVAVATHSGVVRINFNSATISSGSDGLDHTAFYAGLGGDFGYGVDGGGPDGNIYDDASSYLYTSANDTIVDAVDFGATASERWAAVRSNTSGASVLMHLSGGTWSTVSTLPSPVVRMTQDSTGGVYLLFADGLRRWNGSSLVDELVGPPGVYPTAIGGTDAVGYFGTSTGGIRKFDGTSWTEIGPGGLDQIGTMIGFSSTSAVAVDTNGALTIYNGSSWSPPGTYAGYRGLWGTDASHMVLVFFNSSLSGTSFVLHGDPNSFTFNVNPAGSNTPLNAAWGNSDTDFWVVGNNGTVIYYNGSSYTSHAPGTTENLLAVHGTDNSNVWVSGTNGYLAHWNGSSWSSYSLGGSSITALWATPTGRVYFGHDFGTVSVLNPSTGVTTEPLPFANGQMTALGGSSTGGLWAIVGTRVYRGLR